MAARNAWSDRTKWTMGIASALIVAAFVALVSWVFQDVPGVPLQAVPFVASSPEQFAIQSEFRGTAKARGDELSVEVDRAILSCQRREDGYNGPRTIVDVRVSLVEPLDESWRVIRRSAIHEVGRELQPSGEIEVGPFRATMSLTGLESISGTWLVFDINETLAGNATAGQSHAHTHPGLFSD